MADGTTPQDFTVTTGALPASHKIHVESKRFPGLTVAMRDIRLDAKDDGLDYTGGGSTTTLMQNIEILAVDQNLDMQDPNKKNPTQLQSVTLLVVPNQANKLSLAQQKGTLHLSLRNEGDSDPAQTNVVTIMDLRFMQEAPDDKDGKNSSKQDMPGSQRGIQLNIRTLRGGQVGKIQVLQPPARTEAVTATSVVNPM